MRKSSASAHYNSVYSDCDNSDTSVMIDTSHYNCIESYIQHALMESGSRISWFLLPPNEKPSKVMKIMCIDS